MNQNGLTLIETIVVLFIILVLTIIALPYYYNAVESARATEVVALWGRTKNWVIGFNMSESQAQSVNRRMGKTPLRYYSGQIVCREKENPNEICWEAEFTQLNENAHARYKLITTDNFSRLACVPLNDAGETFCLSQALDEKTPPLIDEKKAYPFK